MRTIAVVTGASSGLGWEFARLIDAQVKVDELWLVARRKDRLEALAKLIKNCEPRVVEADLSMLHGVEKLAMLWSEPDIRVRLLINNAGYGLYGPFESVDLEPQLSMIDLNVRALTALCGRAKPYLAEGSTVINIASLAAFSPLGNFAVYAATKAFVMNFSLALAAEWEAQKIHVCTVAPGPVATEFAFVASNGARREVLHGKSAAAVAARALRDALNRRWFSILGWDWQFLPLMLRFVGRRLVARFTFAKMKRPQASGS